MPRVLATDEMLLGVFTGDSRFEVLGFECLGERERERF